MSSEKPHTDPEMPERSPWGIASVALVAGTLQVVASIALGIARLEAFNEAAGEGVAIYLVVAVLIGAGALAIWLVRERMAIAVTLALLWPLGLWLGLRPHTSALGLAYHGEFVLHHFAALLCLALVVSLPIGWARDTRLGRLRWIPATVALPGALALAGAHVAQLPTALASTIVGSRSLPLLGAALLLLAWPLAIGLFWPQLGPRERRPLPILLLLPVIARVATAGPDALVGALTPSPAAVWMGGTITIVGIGMLLILRPRLERWVLATIGTICLLGSMLIYYLYEHGFGEFEDGLGGLLESLFGFAVPYPSYVDDWRSAKLMMGLYFMFVTVYAALVSVEDRVRGLALGLMVVAGVGFSSPHLALMFGAGALLLVETLLPGAPARELDPVLPSFDREPDDDRQGDVTAVRAVLEGLADRLGIEAPTVVETAPGAATMSLRGDVRTTPLDLRAKLGRHMVTIELIIGVPGRGQPVLEIIPDTSKRGQRPAHLLARSHRIRGEARALESLGDAPLDALTAFPTGRLRAWDGGIEIELGPELSGLRVDTLEALVRNLVRALETA